MHLPHHHSGIHADKWQLFKYMFLLLYTISHCKVRKTIVRDLVESLFFPVLTENFPFLSCLHVLYLTLLKEYISL